MIFERKRPGKLDVARIIREFVAGHGDRWDWDELISIPFRDKELDAIAQRVSDIFDLYPADRPGRYCNDEGMKELLRLATLLESGKTIEVDAMGVPFVT